MSFLWESVKQMSQLAGAAALVAGQKTKLKGEMMLVEREVKSRQQLFGVELYDFVAPLAKSPDFFAANDQMTDVIRGPFLTAQREIAAYMIKRGKYKEELAQAEVTRKAAFPTAATTFGEQVYNTGKATAFTANEVRIKTEIGMVDTQIRAFKEEFGETMFEVFMKLEDEQGWLPTVRDIRTMYDKARQDVDKLKTKITEKEREYNTLGTEGDVQAAQFSTTASSTSSQPNHNNHSSSSSSAATAGVYSYSMRSSSMHAPSPLGPQLVVPSAPVSAPAPAFGSLYNSSNNNINSNSSTSADIPTSAHSSHYSFGGYGSDSLYRSPTPTPPSESAAVNGLFLGLSGDRSTPAMTIGQGHTGGVVRKQPNSASSYKQPIPSHHALSSSSSSTTATFVDPFAESSVTIHSSTVTGSSTSSHTTGSSAQWVDPFAQVPVVQPSLPTSYPPVDPFHTGPSSSTFSSPVLTNDPFSFHPPPSSSFTTTPTPTIMAIPIPSSSSSIPSLSSSTPSALPYDPFAARQPHHHQFDDPFADLVANRQK